MTASSKIESASEKSTSKRRPFLESKSAPSALEVEPEPYKHPRDGAPVFHWRYSPMHVEYFLASPMGNFFHKIGWSPNHVTMMNLVFRVWIVYMMTYNADQIVLLLFCTALTQTLDCVDGLMARRFNMCSEFGQILDISCDVFFGVSQGILMVYQGFIVHGMWGMTSVMLASQLIVCYCSTANATQQRHKPLHERPFTAQIGQFLEEFMMINLLTFQCVNYTLRSR